MKASAKYRDLVAHVIGAIPSVDAPAGEHVPATVQVSDLQELRKLALECEDEIIGSEKPRTAFMRGGGRRRRDPVDRHADVPEAR